MTGSWRGDRISPSITMRKLILLLPILTSLSMGQTARWSEAKANGWYAKQPWLVGSNYIPATAINELEMWQADTFDPKRIDLELGWAESIGMNTMRVFLHDLSGSRMRRVPQAHRHVPADLRPSIRSGRCLCCSIPAGIRFRSLVRSTPPSPGCTIRAGCRVPGAEGAG